MILLLLAGTFALAYASAKNAIGNISRRYNPALALNVVPGEPTALSFVADQQFLASQTPASLNKVEHMARRALSRQPLNASAVRLLGYVADAHGNKDRARKTIASAAALSRREFGAQLWLIEDAVARNRKADALRHYDIALRSTNRSHPVLIPVLTAALADPEVQNGLVPYIKQGANWVPAFLSDATTNGNNPVNVVDLLLRSSPLSSSESTVAIGNGLLGKLAEKNQFTAFRRLYPVLPGSKAGTLDSVDLNSQTVSLVYPISGWSVRDHPSAGVTFSEPTRNGAIKATVFAGSGERQELLRKYTFYKPGNYRFVASYEAAKTATDGQISWNFQCVSTKGTTPVWLKIAAVKKGPGSTSTNFNVPAGCMSQLLSFSIAGGTDQIGAELVLRNMSIKPI